MTARPRYGVRKIEDVEGGCIAWLYPGGADLDDTLVQIGAHLATDEQVEWSYVPILEEVATSLPEPVVGYYRRMPWCHCGYDHTWHFEPARGPGRGVSLAVVVASW